jgi:heptose I phosphotransferase
MIQNSSLSLDARAGDSSDSCLEPVGDGRMWVGRGFQSRLREAGLAAFEDVMESASGHCLRELKVRENWFLPASEAAHNARGMYLKKHRKRTWLSRLRAWLGIGPGETPARLEVKNVEWLSAQGILVMRVVAYGEKLHADGLLESFLLTEELQGYENLEEFLLRRFARVDRDLMRLIRDVAEVARRFHKAGYNHRDFYSCHFFVKETGPGEFDIRMIDLQRVQRRRWFRLRWVVKDLAQLAFSAPRDIIGCKHRLAFMHHYLGVRKLGAADRRLLRLVMLKQRLMHWRLRNKIKQANHENRLGDRTI